MTHKYESCCCQSLCWPLCALLLSKFRDELYLRAGGKSQCAKWHRNSEKLSWLGLKFRFSLTWSTCAKLLCPLYPSFFVCKTRKMNSEKINKPWSSWCFSFCIVFRKAQSQIACELRPLFLSLGFGGKCLPSHGFMLVISVMVWIVDLWRWWWEDRLHRLPIQACEGFRHCTWAYYRWERILTLFPMPHSQFSITIPIFPLTILENTFGNVFENSYLKIRSQSLWGLMEKQKAHVDISWMVFYKNNMTLKTFKKTKQSPE